MKRWDFDLQLFSPGSAGANVVGPWGAVPILRLRPGATALTTPLAGYGAIGVNDSGMVLYEAKGFTKWGFQLCPEPTGTTLPAGYTVTVYYTIMQVAGLSQNNAGQPFPIPNGSTIVPCGGWAILPSPDVETGTGADANPMTSANPQCIGSRLIIAARVCLTAITGPPSAGAVVYGGAAP